MSIRRIAGVLLIACASVPAAAQGQRSMGEAQTGTPPERIDLTVTSRPVDTTREEECRRQEEAAVVSGEIVVCGTVPREDQRLTTRREAQDRYAARTAFRDDPATPDVAGAGIFRGKPTFSGLCVKGVLNCPRPPALFVDVTALPQAPPGSDADRIAKGLAPRGEGAGDATRALSAQERAELGLPAPLAASPAQLAAPAAPQ